MRRSYRSPSRSWRGLLAATRCFVGALAACIASAQSPDTPALRFDLAGIRAQIDDGRYSRAESAARELVGTLEREPKSQASLADAVLLLAEALRFSDRVLGDEALATAERAVELASALPGVDRERVAASLLNLGHLRYMRDEYTAARTALDSSLRTDEASPDAPHARAGLTLALLGSLTFDETHDRDAANEWFERAREIQEATVDPTHHDVGFRHLLQGNVANAASDPSTARDEYMSALSIWRTALRPQHPLIGRALNNLGIPLHALGDYASARTCFREALEIRVAALGPQHRHVASTLGNLAGTELMLNNPAEARARWQEAVDIETRAGGARGAKCQAYLLGIGDCLSREGHESRSRGDAVSAAAAFAEAARVFEQVLSILDERRGADSRESVDVLIRLANARRDEGAVEPAGDLYDRAHRIVDGGDDLRVASRVYLAMSQAELDLVQGRASRARERIEGALTLMSETVGEVAPFYPQLLHFAARADAALRETDAALERELLAEAITREHLLDTARVLDEARFFAFGDDRSTYLNQALNFALATQNVALRTRAWTALARSRGLVFEETAERSRLARESADPEVAAVARRLATARDECARLAVRGPADLAPEDFRDKLTRARAIKQQAEEALAELDHRLRQTSTPRDVQMTQVLEALPAGSALVAYVRCAPEDATPYYMAFVSPAAHRAPLVERIGAASEIDELTSRMLDAASNPVDLEGYRAVGSRLRELVWDSIRGELVDATEVFVVPDGALSVVNFAALPVADSAYLVETTAPIRFLCTERDLVRSGGVASGRGLLAVGGPSFDRHAPSTAQRDVAVSRATVTSPASYADLSFGALPGSAEEAASIRALWLASGKSKAASEGVELLTGNDATEATFKRLAPGRRVLHLATHGFSLSSAAAARSATARGVPALRPTPPLATPMPLKPSADPLLRSGLAFAGANHRSDAQDAGDDGILTAEEIVSLDLSSVECAVLSACHSGLGEIAVGEGIFGLRRAFQMAGVHSLVVSLWPVDDETTNTWMTALYGAGLADGVDAATAVRAASLATLRARRQNGQSVHPYYWCAFMAIGSNRGSPTMDSNTGRTQRGEE